MSLVQRSFRTPANTAPAFNGGTYLDPGTSSEWRPLRVSVLLTDPNGTLPMIVHYGSGGQVLGTWHLVTNDGAVLVAGSPVLVIASTAPTVLPPTSVLALPNDGTTFYGHITIPADLIVLSNEKLAFVVSPGAPAPTYGSEIFWTAAFPLP